MTKIEIITTVCLLIGSTVFAQSNDSVLQATDKGKFLIGGSFSFDYTNTKNTRESDFNSIDGNSVKTTSFSPEAGYFIIDNLAIGILSDFISTTVDNALLNAKFKSRKYTHNAFAKYYFLNGNFRPFAQGSIGIGKSEDTEVSAALFGDQFVVTDSRINENQLFNYGFVLGAAYFFNNFVAAEVGLTYRKINATPQQDNSTNEVLKSSNLGMAAGFTISL